MNPHTPKWPIPLLAAAALVSTAPLTQAVPAAADEARCAVRVHDAGKPKRCETDRSVANGKQLSPARIRHTTLADCEKAGGRTSFGCLPIRVHLENRKGQPVENGPTSTRWALLPGPFNPARPADAPCNLWSGDRTGGSCDPGDAIRTMLYPRGGDWVPKYRQFRQCQAAGRASLDREPNAGYYDCVRVATPTGSGWVLTALDGDGDLWVTDEKGWECTIVG